MQVQIRLFDEADNKYDLFSGPAADCPPLPREGELIRTGHLDGRLMETIHDYSQADVVYITLKIVGVPPETFI